MIAMIIIVIIAIMPVRPMSNHALWEALSDLPDVVCMHIYIGLLPSGSIDAIACWEVCRVQHCWCRWWPAIFFSAFIGFLSSGSVPDHSQVLCTCGVRQRRAGGRDVFELLPVFSMKQKNKNAGCHVYLWRECSIQWSATRATYEDRVCRGY